MITTIVEERHISLVCTIQKCSKHFESAYHAKYSSYSHQIATQYNVLYAKRENDSGKSVVCMVIHESQRGKLGIHVY